MKSKIIAYSLYGSAKLYCQGMMENITLAPKIYPGWIVRVYIAEDCPALKDIQNTGCEVVIMPPTNGIDRRDSEWTKKPEHFGMLWRLEALGDKSAQRVIFRDADSRLSCREKAAVDEWIKSGKLAHSMHDHPAQLNSVFMTGMSGFRGGLFPNIKAMISKFISEFKNQSEPAIFSDLIFLRDVIYPFVQHSTLFHGLWTNNPFPPHSPMEHGSFVGECVSEQDRYEIYEPRIQ